MEDDLQPTPREEDLSEEEVKDEGDPLLVQEEGAIEPHNLAEEDLEAMEGTNSSPNTPNKNVASNNQERNDDNHNIMVIQMVTDLQQNARTP
eukprot:14675357-Ditylum_brightwellii.AAC.2